MVNAEVGHGVSYRPRRRSALGQAADEAAHLLPLSGPRFIGLTTWIF
jgi:hypothetical protein